MSLPITKWNYIHLPGSKYIGPMAQDFYASFNVSGDSTHIGASAPGNIALVCIKALGKQTQDLRQENAQLQSNINDLQDKYNTMLAEIENLKTIQAQCCGNTTGNNSQTGIVSSDQPSLAQNVPNPFSQN